MTSTQIAYANYIEQRNNNARLADEQNRHNLATETEAGRHNLATETLESGKLSELNRSNRVNERISKKTLKQRRREAEETGRHNLATETEAMRSNMANERIATDRNVISREQIAADIRRAQIAANAQIQAANISASAHITAAQFAANASNYAADAATLRQKMQNYSNEQIAGKNRASNEQIAEGDRIAQQIVRTAELAQKAYDNSEDRKLERQRIKLTKQYNKAIKAYNEGKLTNEQYKIILDAAKQMGYVTTSSGAP